MKVCCCRKLGLGVTVPHSMNRPQNCRHESVLHIIKYQLQMCCCRLQPKSKVVISKDPNVVSSQEEEEDVAKGRRCFSI